MVTVLTIFGIFALMVIIKFIYETYLKRNTESIWEDNIREVSDSLLKTKTDQGLDFSAKLKSNQYDRNMSLLRLAINMKCLPDEVKDKYLNELREKNLNLVSLMEIITNMNSKKHEQSEQLKIHPDDTPSSLLGNWTQEYIDNKDYADRKRSEKEAGLEFLLENPNLLKSLIKRKLNDSEHKNEIDPDLLSSIIEEMAYAECPAEKYRRKAIDKIFDNKDFPGAIQLLNRGLQINEPETEPFLFKLRAECHYNLMNYKDSLFDINKAIESLQNNKPDDDFTHSDFLKYRSKIKEKIGDFDGYINDKRLSEEYYAKYEANNPNYEEDDTLPF